MTDSTEDQALDMYLAEISGGIDDLRRERDEANAKFERLRAEVLRCAEALERDSNGRASYLSIASWLRSLTEDQR